MKTMLSTYSRIIPHYFQFSVNIVGIFDNCSGLHGKLWTNLSIVFAIPVVKAGRNL